MDIASPLLTLEGHHCRSLDFGHSKLNCCILLGEKLYLCKFLRQFSIESTQKSYRSNEEHTSGSLA